MSNSAHPVESADPMSKTRLRVWLRLLKASRLVEDNLRRRLREESDWAMSRFDLMSALDRAPEGLKMSEISKRLMISNGNVTAIVDKLTDEGLARRVSLPGDRRAYLVKLTEEGKSQFAKRAEAHEQWVDALLSSLGPKESTIMMRKLDDMITHLEGRDSDP